MLTGGGDCPGLNAVIRAVVRKGVLHFGDEFVGFLEGWRGVIDDRTMPLDLQTTSGILHRGGTILRSSRTNVKKIEGGFERCLAVMEGHKLDALIAMGGDDTQSISVELAKRGVKCIGVPKTIDNDLSGTDVCFGFDTAVTIATEAVDRLHSTTEAHSRVQVVEVMGRDAGWIAVTAGIAGGADVILAPEMPIDMDDVVRLLRARWESGKRFALVVVAEGAKLPQQTAQTWTHSAMYGSAASGRCWRKRLKIAQAMKPAASISAIRSAVAPPPPMIACWRPATAWPPSTSRMPDDSAGWWC
jgi:6-phosphofructokinase 1